MYRPERRSRHLLSWRDGPLAAVAFGSNSHLGAAHHEHGLRSSHARERSKPSAGALGLFVPLFVPLFVAFSHRRKEHNDSGEMERAVNIKGDRAIKWKHSKRDVSLWGRLMCAHHDRSGEVGQAR